MAYFVFPKRLHIITPRTTLNETVMSFSSKVAMHQLYHATQLARIIDAGLYEDPIIGADLNVSAWRNHRDILDLFIKKVYHIASVNYDTIDIQSNAEIPEILLDDAVMKVNKAIIDYATQKKWSIIDIYADNLIEELDDHTVQRRPVGIANTTVRELLVVNIAFYVRMRSFDYFYPTDKVEYVYKGGYPGASTSYYTYTSDKPHYAGDSVWYGSSTSGNSVDSVYHYDIKLKD